jgi:hypothetical protein
MFKDKVIFEKDPEKDPDRWYCTTWVNLSNGQRHKITTKGETIFSAMAHALNKITQMEKK